MRDKLRIGTTTTFCYGNGNLGKEVYERRRRSRGKEIRRRGKETEEKAEERRGKEKERGENLREEVEPD